MAPSRTLVLLVSLAAVAVSSPLHRKPVKRDSPNLHIVEAPVSLHSEISSHHSDQQSSSHHLDQPSSQSHHLSHPSSHMHHLDQSSSHMHHLDQSSQKHHLDQSSHSHLDQPQNGPVNSIHDQNEVHPQSKLEKKSRKGPKKGRKSNEDILHHVGMTKLRSPAINHHRKRLASQSRKTHGQKSTSDSKMFVIKLPPNPYYYAHHNLKGLDVVEPQPNSVNKVGVVFEDRKVIDFVWDALEQNWFKMWFWWLRILEWKQLATAFLKRKWLINTKYLSKIWKLGEKFIRFQVNNYKFGF